MAGLFFGNRKGYDFYCIELKNANVRLRFANRTYERCNTLYYSRADSMFFYMFTNKIHKIRSGTKIVWICFIQSSNI